MPASIEYFFAPQSPWTYLGHARFAALVQSSRCKLRVVPCDLGPVFAASGGLPLAQRAPQRQAYRMVELRRFSAHLGIDLHLQPRFFPVNPESAARLIIAADAAHGPAAALKLGGALGRAVWSDERNIADLPTLAAIASACGHDGSALLAASHSEAVARTYEANTKEAIERSVFGAPTYFLDGEPFWGQDRLDFLQRALARLAT